MCYIYTNSAIVGVLSILLKFWFIFSYWWGVADLAQNPSLEYSILNSKHLVFPKKLFVFALSHKQPLESAALRTMEKVLPKMFNQTFLKNYMPLTDNKDRILTLWLNIVSKMKPFRLTNADKFQRVHLHQKIHDHVFPSPQDYCSACMKNIDTNWLQPWGKKECWNKGKS